MKNKLKNVAILLVSTALIFAVVFGLVKILTHKIEGKVTPYALVNSIIDVKGASVDYKLTTLLNTKVLNVVVNIDNVDENATITNLDTSFTTDCTTHKYQSAVLTFVKGTQVLKSQANACLVL